MMFCVTAELPRTLLRAVLRLAEANFALGALLVNVAVRWWQTVQRRPPPLQDGDQTIRRGALEETQMTTEVRNTDFKRVFFKDEKTVLKEGSLT